MEHHPETRDDGRAGRARGRRGKPCGVARRRRPGAWAARRAAGLLALACGWLPAAISARAAEMLEVSLADTVARSDRILLVEVLEPMQSASPCYVDYSFRYRVERTLRGVPPAAGEGVYVDTYPRGDVTVEQCAVSFSFEVYEGSLRRPFERGQRLVLFLGEHVPLHAFESADRLAEIERLAGPPSVPPPPSPSGPPVGVVPPPSPAALQAPPPPGPTVLESDGRVVESGDTELVFVSDESGVAVVGAAAGGTRAGGGPVACRTPCRIRVPNGSYVFRVGTHEFTVAATGGEQTWEVEEANEAALAAGENLVWDGIGSLVGGGILVGAELGREGGSETGIQAIIGYTLLGLGAASILIGAPLWALCGGSAEEVSRQADAGTPAVFVVPGPVALDPWTGRTAWGLVFALGL